MSNPILTRGNTYVCKPPCISLKIVVFWGVFTLGSIILPILSCFICLFSSIYISSSRNISWCAAISRVHTFCVLLWQAEELRQFYGGCPEPPGRVPWGALVTACLPAPWGLSLLPLCVSGCPQTWDWERGAPASTERFLKTLIRVWNMPKELVSLPLRAFACAWELSLSLHHTQTTYRRVYRLGWRSLTSCPHVANVDFLSLCILLGTILPPAQGFLCEKRCENNAG